ncbi:hypothetical protein J0J23_22400, partial [Vibrio vulnificus]|uniref:hypothetical protein n=1 Tax=Vibrio vulnificus TaxID=672 RepID=UPI0019D479C9
VKPNNNYSNSFITMKQCYAFKLQQRIKEGKTILRCGRLLQQYIVDAFVSIEEQRLDYIRKHQNDLSLKIIMKSNRH